MSINDFFKNILHVLGFDEKNRAVFEYIDTMNMRISIPLAVYTLVVEYFMYNRSVFLWGLISKKSYNLMFYVLGFAAVQLLIVALLYETRKYRNTLVCRISLYFYLFACFIIGQSIATYDYSVGKQAFVFLPMVAWTFALVLMFPLVSIFGGYLSFILIPDITNTRVILSDYVNRVLLIFAIMIVIVSIVRWIDQLGNGRNTVKIQMMNDKLKEISVTDELTGIKNRYGLHSDIEKFVGRKLVVMMSDIDDFKYYNDTYGHDTGDKVLKHMADTLCATFGKENVYRFGGDEFLLILPEWDQVKLLSALSEWKSRFHIFECDDKTLHLGSTAGYTYGMCRNAGDVQKMVSVADSRLYDGKMTHKGSSIGCEYDANKPLDEDSLKQMESALRSGEMDTLTKLPNMMYFRSKADLLADGLRLSGKKPVVAYLNLTNFNNYNRKYGFEAGDNLLLMVANFLTERFRNEMVCRFTDDHFTILTTRNGLEEKLREIAEEIQRNSGEANVSLKAGLYEVEDEGIDISRACENARQAMENAGSNELFYWYDEEMHHKLEIKQYIQDNFDKALENGWFDVVYQPIIRSVNKLVCGMETLPRWNDPEYGIIEPEVYVPILEESHQILEHDLFVLDHAIKDFFAFRDSGNSPVPFVMNLSYRDFDREDMVDKIVEMTKEIDHSMVHFDINSSAVSKAGDYLKNALNTLTEKGYQLWMDGYGSENSTIDILYKFNMHGIKLDLRSLHDIRDGSNQSILVEHIISMCKEMGISTLALGVESREEEQFLIRKGCEFLQGFLYSSSVSFEECMSGEVFKSMKFEPLNMEDYYDAISRVDLSKPTRIEDDDNLESKTEDLPAAICELRDELFRVMAWNDSFIPFLNSLGIPNLDIYESRLNCTGSELRKRHLELCRQLRETSGWKTMTLGNKEKTFTGSFHVIAADPTDENAFSVVGIIADMRQYDK